jgi:hypothetical protein
MYPWAQESNAHRIELDSKVGRVVTRLSRSTPSVSGFSSPESFSSEA